MLRPRNSGVATTAEAIHHGRGVAAQSRVVQESVFAADGSLDAARLRNQLASSLDEVGEELVVRTFRAPGATTMRAYVPFDVLFPPGGRGFRLPEMDEQYQLWKSNLVREFGGAQQRNSRIQWLEQHLGGAGSYDQLTDDELLAAMLDPKTFVKAPNPTGAVAGRKAATLVDALMGPGTLRTFEIETPNTRAMKMYPGVDLSRTLREVPPGGQRALAAALNSEAKLTGYVNEALEELGISATERPHYVGIVRSYFERHIRQAAARAHGGPIPAEMLDDIDALGIADLSEEALQGMLGKTLHPTDMVHRVIESHQLTERWTRQIVGEFDATSATWDEISSMPGFNGLMDDIVRRSGHQKGHVFEVECIIKMRMNPNGTLNNDRIFLQVYINGLKGPDFCTELAENGANGLKKVRIGQAKSYSSHWRLTGSRRRFSGGILKQFRSDLRRLITHHGDDWSAGRSPRIRVEPGDQGMRELHTEYDFLIDDSRLGGWIDHTQPDAAQRLRDLREAGVARMNEYTDEVNSFLRADPGDGVARTAIRKKSREVLFFRDGVAMTPEKLMQEQMPAMRIALEQADNAAIVTGELALDTIDPRLLFAMRLAMDDKSGVVDVSLARKIYLMEPPFQLRTKRMAPDSYVPWEGTGAPTKYKEAKVAYEGEKPDPLAEAMAAEDAAFQEMTDQGLDPFTDYLPSEAALNEDLPI
jgi:hypothetical protein